MTIVGNGNHIGGRIARSGRQSARLFLATVLWVSIPVSGLAFMDHGGRISRDLATATVASEDVVLLTWAGTGLKSEKLTLFAFCADGSCDTPPALGSYIAPASCTFEGVGPVISNRCDQSRGCLWGWELPNSRGNTSYAPPTVSQPTMLPDGRVFVATADQGGGGTIWAFDLLGHCLWARKPASNNDASGGFYARPAVQELGDQDGSDGRLVFAPSLNNSKMHVLYDGPTGSLSPGDYWVPPFDVATPGTTGGEARFGPIVECAPPSCAAHRVYMGLEQGSSKRGMYAFDVSPSISPDGYSLAWRILDPGLPVRIGGVILQSGSQRYLVANLDNLAGSAVFDVNRAEAGSCGVSTPDCFAIHPEIRGAHRTEPIGVKEEETFSAGIYGTPVPCSSGANCKPVVYIGQKEGGVFTGGEVWKFRLTGDSWANGATGATKWYTPFEDGWGDGAAHKPWPACNGASIPTTSYSSPAVNPLNLHLFIGASHDEGVYRLEQPADRQCPSAAVSPAWFDYYAPSGWRTTAVFSQGGQRIHIGSSEDKLYTLREDLVGCPVEWCYDVGSSGSSGVCGGGGPSPACCTAACS